jgi:hypothetical protein
MVLTPREVAEPPEPGSAIRNAQTAEYTLASRSRFVNRRRSADALLFGRVTYELIDAYEFVVHPRLAGHGPTLFAGLSKHVDLKLVSRLEFGSGAVAMR